MQNTERVELHEQQRLHQQQVREHGLRSVTSPRKTPPRLSPGRKGLIACGGLMTSGSSGDVAEEAGGFRWSEMTIAELEAATADQ